MESFKAKASVYNSFRLYISPSGLDSTNKGTLISRVGKVCIIISLCICAYMYIHLRSSILCSVQCRCGKQMENIHVHVYTFDIASTCVPEQLLQE